METSRRIQIAIVWVFVLIIGGLTSPVFADEAQTTVINWSRLQLSPQQSQMVQVLETDWNHKYLELQPTIMDDQKRLTKLLADPKSDPLEIMALQQNIARKRQQLCEQATANYLRKRQLLNDNQQHQLEDMVRQAVAERQRSQNNGSQIDAMPDRIQGLMKRIQSVFPGAQQ